MTAARAWREHHDLALPAVFDVGLGTLDPNVKHPGAWLSGSIVQVRLVAESLKCRGLLHLLLRFESSGLQRHMRVAPPRFSND